MPEIDVSVNHQINLIPETPTVVTGTMGDGSCFIHSLVFGMSAKEYIVLSYENRNKYVTILRDLLSKNFTYDEWININNIELVINVVLKNVIEKLYERNEEFVRITKFKTHESFLAQNPYDTIFNVRKWSPELYTDRLSDFIGEKFAGKAVRKALKLSYEQFLKDMANPNEWIGDDIVERNNGFATSPMIRPILEKMGVFVILINDEGDLYQDVRFPREYLTKFRNVVIINYTGDSHYDSMGIVTENGSVQRLFRLDDVRIQPLLNHMIDLI
jgi:hypothetical protein